MPVRSAVRNAVRDVFKSEKHPAVAVLSKFGTNAHCWVPGVGYFNGLQAANFIDSAGTQPGLVDNPVGLVMDAANASLGAELVTNGDFSQGSTGWTLGAGWAVSNGELTGTSLTTNADYSVATTTKLYRVSYTIKSITGTISVNLDTTVGTTRTTAGTYSEYLLGTAVSGTFLRVQPRFGSTPTVVIDDISVKEVVGGVISTQATTANKPILRRGAVNIRSYSDAILASNGYSILNSALATITTVTPTGSTTASLFTLNVWANTGNSTDGFNFGSFALTNSTQYTQSLFVKPAGTTILRIRSNISGLVADFTLTGNGTAPSLSAELQAASIVPSVSGWYRVSWVFTSTTSVPGNRGDYWTVKTDVADGTNGVYVAGAQLELGSTANQYIPTTTATATSSAGNYYWEFDGVNDSLALSSVPFQMADNFAIVAGMRGASLTQQDTFAVASTANANPLIKLGLTGSSQAQFVCRDDVGSTDNVTLASPLYGQTLVVLTGKKNGNDKTLRINGAANGTSSSSLGATTFTGAGIGHRPLVSPSFVFLGSIYPVIAIKGTVSDADLLILERWVGQMSGVSI